MGHVSNKLTQKSRLQAGVNKKKLPPGSTVVTATGMDFVDQEV